MSGPDSLAEPSLKAFSPLFRMLCDHVKQFADDCSALPSVSAEHKAEVKHDIEIFLLDALISRKTDVLVSLGLADRLI